MGLFITFWFRTKLRFILNSIDLLLSCAFQTKYYMSVETMHHYGTKLSKIILPWQSWLLTQDAATDDRPAHDTSGHEIVCFRHGCCRARLWRDVCLHPNKRKLQIPIALLLVVIFIKNDNKLLNYQLLISKWSIWVLFYKLFLSEM